MKYEPADIFFVAGEASGDLEGAVLAGALSQIRPSLALAAYGGQRLAAAGARLLFDSSELASIGPVSILPKIPYLYYILRFLDASMRRRPPGIFIPIDVGAFNLRLSRLLRNGGFSRPIVYYFPPGAWLDDVEQARKVSAVAIALTPFEHQRDFYVRLGLRAAYFGHPLVSVIKTRASEPAGARPVIAVLPGSRGEEVAHHLPVLARAALEVERRTSASFVAVASSAQREQQIRKLWGKERGPQALSISRAGTTDVLAGANLAWVASGTAVLEAALVGVPQITFYVVSPTQWRMAQERLSGHIMRVGAITLPNLVLERKIVPELLQLEFTPQALVDQTMPLLDRSPLRDTQLEGYQELRGALGPSDALQQISAFVLEQLDAQVAS